MANESLDQRLSQIMPAEVEQQLPADLPRADVELADAGDDTTIQVAGLSDKIIQKFSKVVTDFGGPAGSKIEKAAAEKKLLQETEKVIPPSVGQQVARLKRLRQRRSCCKKLKR